MARPGKKPHHDKPVEWKVSIPSSTAARVALILADPLTGQPKHGARGRLINQLLVQWLKEQSK